MRSILFVLACIPSICAEGVVEEARVETLRLVQAIWRHGDRTPSTLLPGDPQNNIDSWVLGLGELTKLGAEQEFRLGQFIRKRYAKFISTEYSPFEIYVRSSDYNRTLASGQAVMAGLYSVNGALALNPVPIHTVSKAVDSLMYDRIPCPVADVERERVYAADPSAMKVEAENTGIFKYLGEHSGLGSIPLRLRQMWFLFDPLNSVISHPETHSLPNWVNKTIKDEIWRIYEISAKYLYHSDLLKRLRGGPIFDDVTRRMIERKNELLDSRFRFYGYSGHDTTISALLGAFGITLETFPTYSTALFVELHYEKNDYVVRLFYKSETDSSSVVSLDVPGCTPDCLLDHLMELRRYVIPVNWESECGFEKWYHFKDRSCMIFAVSFLIFVAVFTIIAKNGKICKRRQSHHRVDEMELKVELNASESGIHLLSEDSDDSEI